MMLLIFILAGFGVTTIITKSEIFSPLRRWLDTGGSNLANNFFGFLIVCPMCVGFWVGVFQSITMYSPSIDAFWSDYVFSGIISYIRFTFITIYSMVLDGAMLGGISWTIHIFLDYLDKKYDYLQTKELYYQWVAAKSEKEKGVL